MSLTKKSIISGTPLTKGSWDRSTLGSSNTQVPTLSSQYGAMAKIIIDRGLMKANFIKAHCSNYEEFAKRIRNYDVLWCAERCGLSATQIEVGPGQLGGEPAVAVGVLEPEDEGAAHVAREEVVEERGAGRPDVERPGRAGCDAAADGHAAIVADAGRLRSDLSRC